MASKKLGDLVVALTADTSQFTQSIQNSQKEILKVGAIMSAAGTAVTAAFVGMAKQAANYGDQIRDASIRTGVSTQALSGLKLAAEQTGTSFEAINTGLTRMSRSALSAADGSNASAKAFAAIGVSVKDASGNLRPMESLLGDVADKFAKMKDGTEKAALAQQLFGRGGTQMIEFLNQGSAGIAKFNEMAAHFNLVVGDEAATAADDFNDSLGRLSSAQLGLSNGIGQALLPLLTKIVDTVSNVIAAIARWTAAHPELTRAIFILGGIIGGAGGLLVGLAGVMAVMPALTAAFAVLTGPVGLAAAAIAAFVGAMALFPQFRAVVSDALKNVIGLFGLVHAGISNVSQAMQELVTGNFKKAFDTIKNTGTASVNGMVKALDAYDSTVAKASSLTKSFGTSATSTSKALQSLNVDFEALTKGVGKTTAKVENLETVLSRANLSGPINRFKNNVDLLTDSISTMFRVAVAVAPPLIDDMEMLNVAIKSNIDFSQKAAQQEADIFAARQKDIEAYTRKIEQATEDVKRSAGKIFDDMFIKGENVFTSLTNLLKGGALSLGRAIFEDVVGTLLGPIKAAFDDFFKGLIQNTVGGFIKDLGSKIGGLIPGIGRSATSAVGGAAGTAGGAAGSVGGVAGSSLGGSLLSGGLAAAGSIVGSLMTKGNLKRTEENTRESRDWLELMAVAWDPLFHLTEGWLKLIEGHTRNLSEWVIPSIEMAQKNVVDAILGVGPASVAQPAFVGGGGMVANFHFAPGAFAAGSELDEIQVRSMFERTWNDIWENNPRGMADVATKSVVKNAPGVVTA